MSHKREAASQFTLQSRSGKKRRVYITKQIASLLIQIMNNIRYSCNVLYNLINVVHKNGVWLFPVTAKHDVYKLHIIIIVTETRYCPSSPLSPRTNIMYSV